MVFSSWMLNQPGLNSLVLYILVYQDRPDKGAYNMIEAVLKAEKWLKMIYSRLSRSFTARGSVKGGPPRV